MDSWFDISSLSTNTDEVINNIKNLSHESLNRIIDYNNKPYSLLGLAILYKNQKIVRLILSRKGYELYRDEHIKEKQKNNDMLSEEEILTELENEWDKLAIEKKEVYQVNTNGITKNGISYSTPLSLVPVDKNDCLHIKNEMSFNICKTFIKDLLLHKASLNIIGIDGETILTRLISYFKYTKIRYIKRLRRINSLIFYILSKGADPNSPIEKLPLNNLIDIYKTRLTDFMYLKDKGEGEEPSFLIKPEVFDSFLEYNSHVKNLVDNLLYFGANPEQHDLLTLEEYTKHEKRKSRGSQTRPSMTAIELIDKSCYQNFNVYSPKGMKEVRVTLEDIFENDNNNPLETVTKNISDVIEDCNDDKLLNKVAKAFKIPNIDMSQESHRKRLCSCIKFIRNNAEEIDYEEIVKRRKQENCIDCNNITTILGDDIYEFRKEELILYIDPDDNKRWCFHVSEIPTILETKKNMWTGKVINEKDIKKMLEIVEVFPQITLKCASDTNSLKLDSSSSIKPVGIIEHINNLHKLISSYNIYTEVIQILNIPISEIFELFNLLIGFGLDFDFGYIRYLYEKDKRDELITVFYNLVIKFLRYGGNPPLGMNISMLSAIIDQVVKDYMEVQDIINIIGYERFNDLKYDILDKNFTSPLVAGPRTVNRNENEDIISNNYTGGIFLSSKEAEQISDFISMRIGSLLAWQIDEHWIQLQDTFRRN